MVTLIILIILLLLSWPAVGVYTAYKCSEEDRATCEYYPRYMYVTNLLLGALLGYILGWLYLLDHPPFEKWWNENLSTKPKPRGDSKNPTAF